MATASATKTKKIFDGRYEIGAVVGRGAKSVVYQASLLTNPHEQVALKVLLAGDSQNATTERLRREALALVSCRHKYVVRLDDFHSAGPLSYLALEFAPLGDLRRYSTQNELSLETIERFLKQSLEALAYIHRAGIIHRDIKPENILVASDKEIRVTDFGVALLPGEEASLADLQSGIGTMNYMAPEIIEGKQLDARADLYALGVIFYELLAGKNPFEDAPLAQQLTLRKQQSFVTLQSVSKLEVPAYLNEILLRSMSYEPTDRFPTADEMLQALLDGHSAAFEKTLAKGKDGKKSLAKPGRIKRPKTVPLSKRYKYKEAEREAERLFKELFGEDADWLKDTATAEKAQETVADLAQEISLPRKGSGTVVLPVDTVNALTASDTTTGNTTTKATIQELAADATQVTEILEAPVVTQKVTTITAKKTATNSTLTDAPKDVDETDTDDSILSQQVQSKAPFTKFAIPVLTTLFLVFIAPTLIRNTYHLIASISPFKLFSSTAPLLPETVDSGDLSAFPSLPAGVFHGQIKGLLNSSALPISIISYPESHQLGLIVNLEGFRPVWASTENLEANSPILFSSSGLVLEMSGQLVDGQFVGTFKNLVSGRQGIWSLR